ncbi:MAG: hypothetical protein C3F07_17080 [Anaerolineales bacterium]|nr:hypothetical protein [Anaerolineae bacterium]PWB70351.1 MAG: hypothetical protein C3F07_17080 [Anaerolineales bacterium]
MPARKKAEICYIVAFPDPAEESSEPKEKIRGLKDAPYFQPVDVDVRTLGHIEVQAGGVQVSVLRQRYDDRIQIVDCRFQMEDYLSMSAIQEREVIERTLRERFVPVEHRASGMFEEYVILLLTKASPTPEKFVDRNAAHIGRFIRSQREVLDQPELEQILSSRIRYSTQDLTLVDWEGAVIIAANGDFQSDIELLKVGNYQLLRYRMLDQSVEEMLDNINESFFINKRRPRPTRGAVREIVQHRLEVMLDFERTEQNLLLIGDWYTAKLYTAIRDEFYLEEWKKAIRGKLDNLEGIVETIQANFALSFETLMDRLQMLGWVLLLIGYLYLYALDAGWIHLAK